jgi:hypothetical protein
MMGDRQYRVDPEEYRKLHCRVLREQILNGLRTLAGLGLLVDAA